MVTELCLGQRGAIFQVGCLAKGVLGKKRHPHTQPLGGQMKGIRLNKNDNYCAKKRRSV
jgi:hypothetical protein